MDPDQTTPTTTTQVPTFDPASDPEYQAANKVVSDWLNQDQDNPTIGTRQVSDALKVIATKTKGAPHTVIHGDQAITLDPLTGKVINTQAIPGGAASKTQAERDAYVNAENARAASENANATRATAETGAIETPEQKSTRETNLETLRQSGENARNQATIQGTHENVTAQETGANQRNTATEAGATARNQDTIQGTHENVAAQEAGATQRTVLTGQNTLQAIIAQRDADIAKAREKFDQDKDLTAFTKALDQANELAVASAKGEQDRLSEQQKEDFEKPFRTATSAAETQNAATNQRRLEQDAAYQNSTLDQVARRDAAKPLQDLSASMQDMFVNKGGQARTPVAGAADLVFSPLEMAFSLMHAGVRNGTIDANHVPDYGAPSPAGQDSGTPDLNNAPAPQGPVQSLGPMTPQAAPGYQYPQGIEGGLPLGGGNDDRDVIRDHPLHDTAPAPEPDKTDDDEEGG